MKSGVWTGSRCWCPEGGGGVLVSQRSVLLSPMLALPSFTEAKGVMRICCGKTQIANKARQPSRVLCRFFCCQPTSPPRGLVVWRRTAILDPMKRRPPVRPRDIATLRARVDTIKLKRPPSSQLVQARKLLQVYLDTAQAHSVPFDDLVRDLRSGLPALRIAGAVLATQAADPRGPMATAACAPGCAFCCILSGKDGGTVMEVEARALHTALAPLAGQPDGRDWHPRACPALDPDTRMCRAYTARPLICRTYVSSDVVACAAIAEGATAPGAGVLGAQGMMLTVQALVRAALDGISQVPTYAMAKIAAAAVAGQDVDTALRTARQPPRTLEDERLRLGG